jgi:transcriptional regulator with XRE-family HTH domain
MLFICLQKHFLCVIINYQEVRFMPQKSKLYTAPPFEVENALRVFGSRLRTARLRRGWTIADVSARVGAGVRAVGDAEHGKTTTAISVYFALLWLYGLLPAANGLANPLADEEGLRLAALREPKRAAAVSRDVIDNDF